MLWLKVLGWVLAIAVPVVLAALGFVWWDTLEGRSRALVLVCAVVAVVNIIYGAIRLHGLGL